MRPSEHVLDMFAVPGDLEPLPGGQGDSVRAGDLVLSPGRDEATQSRLNPHLARLAADLDTRRGRDRRDLRIAMPVPARDGNWVVDGWGATRYEPGTRRLTDLTAVRAVGAVLHAELARVVRSWPPAAQPPTGRWAVAEGIAFDESDLPEGLAPDVRPLAERLAAARDDTPLGPCQLVHGDLAGNVLLDPDGAPVVIDVAPYWRPALWAEATCVLDGVTDLDADPAVMTEWTKGAPRQAMLRAALFRLLSDRPAHAPVLESALAPVLAGLGA
ncbi:aminoglycoside phosphotransferase [Janibacter anophelis]|uniref:aminoglycoside phosphotransferase n=1 Tax=Janibacter anophelis TaxID=319054 RepID=UPI000DEEC207|nr:aminoglycoside phosphotransferase [Janibacter anophelis]